MTHWSCYKCQKQGHFARDCPSRKASSYLRGRHGGGRQNNYGKKFKIVTSSMWTILTTLYQLTSDLIGTYIWPYMSGLIFPENGDSSNPPTIKNLEGAHTRKFAIKHLLRPHEARKVRAQFFNNNKKPTTTMDNHSLEENGQLLTTILKPRMENYENLYQTKMATDEITLILPIDDEAGTQFLPNIQSKDGTTWTSVTKNDDEKAHDCIHLRKKRASFFSGFQYEAYKMPGARLTLKSLDKDGPIVHLDKVETSSRDDHTVVAITDTFDDGRPNIFTQIASYVSSFF